MWKEYKKIQDETYENLLDRAKAALPEYKVDDNRFNVPEVQSQIQGKRTFFMNFKEIVTALNRDERHFTKFITNDLGTAAIAQGNQVILQGKHPQSQIKKVLQRYIKDYILCPECNKPDTKFVIQGRVTMMKCDACGASSSLRSLG